MTIHICQICGYSTNRHGNLQAHLSKQKSCKPPPHIQEVPLPIPEIVIQELPSPEIDVKVNQCIKCDKILSTPYCLKQHISNCKGCHILQCPTCLKKFASRSSKSQHIKSAKCKPPIKPVETLEEVNNRLLEEIKLKDTMLADLVLPKKEKTKRGFVTPITRLEIASSQNWCCRICIGTLPGFFHIDHTKPLCFGGEDVRENVSALCVPCHALKTHNERKLRCP